MRFLRVALALAGLLAAGSAAPAERPPARRIVTLAPHLAELVYAAGAGDRLVGTVAYSDEPAAARSVTRIGDAFRIDYEQLLALQPDLVLGWPSGNTARTLDRVRALGLRVVGLEPGSLDDIPAHLAAIGALAGTDAVAEPAASRLRDRLARLRQRYGGARPVPVFYQVSGEPLVTVTSAHFIGQALTLCGGANVFGDLPGLTPVVGREAVLATRPAVIFVSEPATGSDPAALAAWRRWTVLPAVAAGRVVPVDPSLMSVPGPRLVTGIERLCAVLEGARY